MSLVACILSPDMLKYIDSLDNKIKALQEKATDAERCFEHHRSIYKAQEKRIEALEKEKSSKDAAFLEQNSRRYEDKILSDRISALEAKMNSFIGYGMGVVIPAEMKGMPDEETINRLAKEQHLERIKKDINLLFERFQQEY
jgi:DNA replication initiation complex subunit (GINS family)